MRSMVLVSCSLLLAMAAFVDAAWAQGNATMPREASQASRPAEMLMMMNSPVAAVLPSSRSVQVGQPATAFATMINMGAGMATSCGMTLPANMPGSFMYQATNPRTNQVVGMPNSPVDMPMGGSQTFMFAFTPTAPMDPTEMAMRFSCTNSDPADVHPGLNTLLISASTTPVPDIVALAATPMNDGIVSMPGVNGTGAFAVATVNMGADGMITVSADIGGVAMPMSLALCQTDPGTGQCMSTIAPTITTSISTGATPTFAVFVAGHGMVPFDPATNRVFLRFRDAAGLVRGATSVAVRTQ